MRGARLGKGQQGDLPRAKSGLGCGGLVGRPWSLPGQPRRPERDDGGSCSKRGGARGGERRGRAGASLPGLRGASPPAEPSPILMTGERARGQEIGAGSCGSGDSAASRRAGGGRPAAGSSPKGRGWSFDPKTALLGSRCREPRRRGGRGAQALGTAGCSAAPPLNRKKKKRLGGESRAHNCKQVGPGRRPRRAGEQSA